MKSNQLSSKDIILAPLILIFEYGSLKNAFLDYFAAVKPPGGDVLLAGNITLQ